MRIKRRDFISDSTGKRAEVAMGTYSVQNMAVNISLSTHLSSPAPLGFLLPRLCFRSEPSAIRLRVWHEDQGVSSVTSKVGTGGVEYR